MARNPIDPNSEPETRLTKLSGNGIDGKMQPDRLISKVDQDAIRKYLLGQLDDDRKQEVEERLLGEDAFFEELEIAEDELIDEYLAAQLTPPDHESFEKYFLATPQRQQSLRFAQAISRNQIPIPHPVPWWNSYLLRAAAALAVVAVIPGILWIIRPQPPTFVMITLGITRGDRAEGAHVVKTKLNVDELRLELLLPEGSTPDGQYRVEMQSESGETKTLRVAKQEGRALSVIIPTSQLARGQYAIKLFAVGANGSEQRINGSYLFAVEE